MRGRLAADLVCFVAGITANTQSFSKRGLRRGGASQLVDGELQSIRDALRAHVEALAVDIEVFQRRMDKPDE
jgi:hypothetical protein